MCKEETTEEVAAFAVSYPLIRHPLADEPPLRKMKYVCLLEHYRKKFLPNDVAAKIRLDRFAIDFMGGATTDNFDVEDALREISRIRFKSFRFQFSYRFIFLFDCIFILAPSNKELANRICDKIKGTYSQRYHKRFDDIVQAMCNPSTSMPAKSLITEEQRKWWNDTQQYLSSKMRTIVFTATMSAGKSTLINAVIGQELSYTKKAACTSTVMEFQSAPTYHTRYNIITDNGLHPNLSPEEVRKFTKDQKQPCRVIGYFETQEDHCCLSIFDTPGVDSSRNPEHKRITREALQNKQYDKIVYVIPVENYGSEDDFAHLQFIKHHVPFKSIVFAVNMMDTCSFEDDDLSEIVRNVTSHLESIGFKRPNVCPISAKAGLLFKRALLGYELSDNDTEKILNEFYPKYTNPAYDLSGFYPKIPVPTLCRRDYKLTQIGKDELLQAYLRTGLPQFEAKLLEQKQVMFHIWAETQYEERLFVIGNIPELGEWNPVQCKEAMLNPNYPEWFIQITVPAGVIIEFKFIKVDGAGNVTWENGANHTVIADPGNNNIIHTPVFLWE